MIIAYFEIPNHQLSLRDGFDRLVSLLRALNAALPEAVWYRLPRGIEERLDGWIPVQDSETFLRQVARDMGDDATRWPRLPVGFEVNVTTASSEKAWDRGGHLVLKYSPKGGRAVLQIDVEGAGSEEGFSNLKNIFVAVCSHLEVKFARCDVTAPSVNKEKTRQQSYSVDFRVFQHRDFLGCVGFVRQKLEGWQVPEASGLLPIEQKGTVIVVTTDPFDLNNPEHIEKAHRVEMRLVDLDLLPVIDPRFL